MKRICRASLVEAVLLAAFASLLTAPGELDAQTTTWTLKLDTPLQSPWPGGHTVVWEPDVAAFRAGYVYPFTTLAYGSAAFGEAAASGSYSFATGWSSSDGEYCSALGHGYATGYCSFAAGEEAYAEGYASIALGMFAYASGEAAAAFGSSTAYGFYSSAFGLSHAGGYAATSMGVQTRAQAYASVAIGRYNVGGFLITRDGDSNNDGNKMWYDTDPLFEVGNGRPGTQETNWRSTLSNAFTVYKNGDARVQRNLSVSGVIRVPPAGDLSMGGFEEGPRP